jgi:Flp pilus assembly protein TadD
MDEAKTIGQAPTDLSSPAWSGSEKPVMNMVAELFETALAHHRAGRIGIASTLYRRILDRTPGHALSLHLLGILAYRAGRYATARALIGKAVTLQPRFAEAYDSLGLVYQAERDFPAATACHRRAIALKENSPEAHNNLGVALRHVGQLAEAAAAFERAAALSPDVPETQHNLGNALQRNGQLTEARARYERALALRPDYPSALNNLGSISLAEGKLNEARQLFERTLTLKPADADAHTNLAILLRREGRFAGALAHNGRALASTPDAAGPLNNRGNLLQDLGHLDEAAAAFERALAIEPDFAGAHHNLGMALLAAGRYEAGWDEYEWRRRLAPARRFAEPQWQGEPLPNGTLLIHAEQGFGDTLQFCRYVPLLARRNRRILLEVPRPLLRLMGSLVGQAPDGIELVAQGDPLPRFDRHCPLMSLPRLCGTTLDTIPANGPYLAAEPAARQSWHRRLRADGTGLRVGLAWAGNPRAHLPEAAAIDRRRSIPPDLLTPFTAYPGIRLYSLQKDGPPAPAALGLIDVMGEMRDFADSAALIANLDLVVSVDTAVAHLAGALGKPVWLLNRFDSCWRWLAGRDDSPWYPTLRLFRQTEPGDWAGVVARMLEALAAEAGR